MMKRSLTADAREQLELAKTHSGRAAVTVFGGHEQTLRQTLIALVAGTPMQEHESPGEATLQVITERIRLTAGDDTWEAREGDLLTIPPVRHAVDALTDAAFLLTVVKS